MTPPAGSAPRRPLRWRPHARLLRTRLRRGALGWSLLGAGAFVLGALLRLPPLWLGVLLCVPLLVTATGLGWRAAAPLLPLGPALWWATQRLAGGEPGAGAVSDWHPLGLLGALTLALAAGDHMYGLWRRTEAQARRNGRRARLLAAATAELDHCLDRDALFAALPRLLSEILDFTHAEVLMPDGDALAVVATYNWELPPDLRVPAASVSGRALQRNCTVYEPDTRLTPDFVQPPDAPETRSELAIPLRLDGRSVAVLNIEHTEPDSFAASDRATLAAFARLAEEALERMRSLELLEAQRREQALLARLNRTLLQAGSAEAAARAALAELCGAVEVESGAVLALHGSRFRPLGMHGDIPAATRRLLEAGLPWGRGQVHRCWSERRSIFIDDYARHPQGTDGYPELGLRATALVPIVNGHGEVQAVMVLASFQRARAWREQQLVATVASALGVALERATADEQLRELLEVVRSLAQSDDPGLLYQQAVEAAVRLIPGAEAASILVRSGSEFRFEAAVGFDADGLTQLPPIPEAEEIVWYGGDPADYRRGVPRLLLGAAIVDHSAASVSGPEEREQLRDAGRLHDLQANICVPVTCQGEVTGILNLDSFSRRDAFGRSALQLAEAFAQQIGVIIRQTEYRDALQRSAVTDPLTGLGNREGFNRQLQCELARAERYGHPLNLVMMDLDGFKAINDTLGHHAGDQALLRVAEAMRAQQRSGDSLFRWGGDEFALILPQVGPEAARVAAGRYAAAIREVRVENARLDVSIGLACYPRDGSGEALLRRADDLMYRHKHRGQPPESARPPRATEAVAEADAAPTPRRT